jgi:tetratricopeptide (TPR) repeat protein
MTVYEQILARQPAHFDCCHLLGVAHMQTGSPELAADLISRALTINPKSADAHYNLGHALRALRRTDEALASIDRAIGLRPGFAEYHLERGIMLQAAGRLPEALACFEEALRLDPAFADSHRRRAGALMKLNRLEEALASCGEAIRLAPRSAEAHSLKGSILGKLDRLEEALGSHDMAIKLNPKSAEAYRQRGRILGALKRLDQSAASYNKAVELDPDHVETYIYLAASLTKLERHEEVLASCDRAIQLKPEYADAHRWRGYALGKLNFMDEALESFERAMSLEKDNGPARLGRAWLHARCERWDLARVDCEVVINRDEMNEAAWLRLALLPEGFLTAERAAEILNHRADLLKGDGLASQLFVKANLLRHLQRYRESFEVLRQANDVRLGEILQPDGWRNHFDKLLPNAQTWSPTRTRHEPGNGAKLLVVLGPSRSGKSTLERLLSGDRDFKRGFEGRAAGPARRYLEKIPVSDGYPFSSSANVQQHVFAALFPLTPEDMLGGEHEVVTITNPFLLAAAPLIFDLYPRSYFIFLQRETIDNAAEIYARDYANECAFSYSPRAALDYVELYQQASDMFASKMGDRAVRISYEDLLVSPEGVLTTIHEMLNMELPGNPALAGAARDTRSVYREFFATMCSEQGIVLER